MGMVSTSMRSAYAASKHALHGFYDSLRAEHHKDNIKVTLICPGYVQTKLSVNALKGDGSKQNKMDEEIGNGMSPDELSKKIIKVIESDKEESYIGSAKEVSAIYLKRLVPGMFSKIVAKMATN